MNSILQDNPDQCYLCGRNGAADPLNRHEVFYGSARRKLSIQYGLTVYICHDRCHQEGPGAVHKNDAVDDKLKRHAQAAAMRHYGWNTAQFVAIFGKNYLDTWEE